MPKDAPEEAPGPSFFPAENVEATLDAPDTPGAYELRYVMNAPLAEGRILARQGSPSSENGRDASTRLIWMQAAASISRRA